MTYTDELMLMMSKFLYGEINAEDFSFDFPARLSFVYDDFLLENKKLCDYIEDEMPEICQWYDSHNTGNDGTYGIDVFKRKVYEVYYKALSLIEPELRKIS